MDLFCHNEDINSPFVKRFKEVGYEQRAERFWGLLKRPVSPSGAVIGSSSPVLSVPTTAFTSLCVHSRDIYIRINHDLNRYRNQDRSCKEILVSSAL